MLSSIEIVFIRYKDVIRLAGPLLGFAIVFVNAPANAQAGASRPGLQETAQPTASDRPQGSTTEILTTDDICRTLEQAAAENALPVEFFARVIWQESRFNARAVSPKGAEGIRNLCHAPLIGAALSIRSIRSRR